MAQHSKDKKTQVWEQSLASCLSQVRTCLPLLHIQCPPPCNVLSVNRTDLTSQSLSPPEIACGTPQYALLTYALWDCRHLFKPTNSGTVPLVSFLLPLWEL